LRGRGKEKVAAFRKGERKVFMNQMAMLEAMLPGGEEDSRS